MKVLKAEHKQATSVRPGYTEFKNRKVAMFAERPWNAIGAYDYYHTMKDEIGIVPVPKGPNADKVYAPGFKIFYQPFSLLFGQFPYLFPSA